jgi:hypothetical protein
MTAILKLISTCILLLLLISSTGQNKKSDSSRQNKDTIIINIQKDTGYTIRQATGEILKIEEVKKGVDVSTVVAIFAAAISILAIFLPIQFNLKAERRSSFFKMYEHWNTDYMLKCRRRFWDIVQYNRTAQSKISLIKLRDRSVEDYHIYETVYDFLNDLARIYNDNHVDRELVKSVMISFIRSYGNALEQHFEYHITSNSFLVKMGPEFYKPVIDLRNKLCKNEPKTYAAFDDRNSETEEFSSNSSSIS